MYCAVEKLQLKKPIKAVTPTSFRIWEFPDIGNFFGGLSSYCYEGINKMERKNKSTYKFTFRFGSRVDGKVKTESYHIVTISAYDLITYEKLEPCALETVNNQVEKLMLKYPELTWEYCYAKLDEKLKPLKEQLKKDWHDSDEYRQRQINDKLSQAYENKKKEFMSKYNHDTDSIFTRIYDFYLVCRRPEYLAKIERQNTSGYSRNNSYSSYNNYNNNNYKSNYSYTAPKEETNVYSDSDKELLKKMKKQTAMVLHPDKYTDNNQKKLAEDVFKQVNALMEKLIK
jgi:hypothetical protein